MTNETKPAEHTPGRWSRNIPPAKRYPIIFAGRNTHICHIISLGLTDEEVEANCNLITAAPDMLKALEHIEYALTKGCGKITPDSAEHSSVRDAIRKARGL
jgi:hypothetical protein